MHQVSHLLGEPVEAPFRQAILDGNVLALDVAGFTNALSECGQKACTIGKERPRAAEEPDHRHGRLLRARRERPSRRGTAEQYAELATSHSIASSARARIPGGNVSPIALAVLRLTARSNLTGCSTGRSAGLVPCKILCT